MTFNERIEAYQSITPQWIKDLPKDLIADIEDNGWECYDTFSAVRFCKNVDGLTENRANINKDGLSIYIGATQNVNNIDQQIKDMQDVKRWAQAIKEHFNKQDQ